MGLEDVTDGEVLFRGDTILHVGPASDAAADETIDCGEALIAPGFIDLNALADIDTTILGFGGESDRRAKGWSRRYAEAGRRDVLSLSQQVSSARFVFAQLLLSGITTALPVTSLLFRRWAETAEEFSAIAGLAEELGIRLVLGPSFRSAINVVEEDGSGGQYVDDALGQAGLEDAIGFVERSAGHGPLVSGLLVPSTIETCSDDLLRRTADAARDLDVPFRLHCCQSLAEAQMIWKRSSKTSIGHLAALGVLGERALLPHAVDLGGPARDAALVENDIALLAGSGATVVHCPLVIGRNGRRLESFAKLRAQGIRIGLGTDTAPPDMLMNLQIGLAMARSLDGAATSPADLFRAATTEAANAIGRPDLGRLAKGARADIVVWDLAAPRVMPVFDPLAALFLMPPGGRARDVWVHGRRSVRNHAPVAFDPAGAVPEIARISTLLLDSFAERHAQNMPWQDLFPPTFKSVPAGRPAA